MDALAQLEYLFAGFAVFWGGLLVYLVILQSRLRALQAEVARLEERLAEAALPAPAQERALPRSSTADAPPSRV